jgi:hypothetical protein
MADSDRMDEGVAKCHTSLIPNVVQRGTQVNIDTLIIVVVIIALQLQLQGLLFGSNGKVHMAHNSPVQMVVTVVVVVLLLLPYTGLFVKKACMVVTSKPTVFSTLKVTPQKSPHFLQDAVALGILVCTVASVTVSMVTAAG